MAIMTSAGSTLSISAAIPGTADLAGYTALTWTEIGEISDMGEYGKEFALVTFTPLGSRAVQKLKGSYNNGSLSLQMAKSVTNAGQVLLAAALASDANYSFKITLQDLSKAHFGGKVMSAKTIVGSIDQITGANCTIEISTDIVES